MYQLDRRRLTCGRVPNVDILSADDHETLAVRRVSNVRDRIEMLERPRPLLGLGWVPYIDGAIVVARGCRVAIRPKGHVGYTALVAPRRGQPRALRQRCRQPHPMNRRVVRVFVVQLQCRNVPR